MSGAFDPEDQYGVLVNDAQVHGMWASPPFENIPEYSTTFERLWRSVESSFFLLKGCVFSSRGNGANAAALRPHRDGKVVITPLFRVHADSRTFENILEHSR